MKKLLALTFLLSLSVFFATAQIQTYYVLKQVGSDEVDVYTFYKIDRAAKEFFLDSDSPSDSEMLMKNYKKAGNKETFDLHPKFDPSMKIYSVEFVVDASGKQIITLSNDGEVVRAYEVGTKEQQQAEYNAKRGISNTPATENKVTKPSVSESKKTEPATTTKGSGLKKVLDKGVGVFKKKN